ncbi:MAG: HYR domain-containing protein, partial [Draconibacterium sp.]
MTKQKNTGITGILTVIFTVFVLNSGAAHVPTAGWNVAISSVVSVLPFFYNFSDADSTGNINTENAIAFKCPENISANTNTNDCTSLITNGLNLNYPFAELKSLTWSMRGATTAQSPARGVNQINAYVFNPGTTTITYEGRTKINQPFSCSFAVTVADRQPPRFIHSPGDITVANAPGECNARVTWTEPLVVDNCVASDLLKISSNYKPGDIFPVGTTEVMYRVSDGTNESRHSFLVTVLDEEQPHLTAPKPRVIVCGETVEDAFITWKQFEKAGGLATDNCEIDYNSFRYVSQRSNAIRCPYIITRTYRIADKAGNIALIDRLIEVTGEQPEIDPENPDISQPVLKSGQGTTVVTISQGGITHVTCKGETNGEITVNVTTTNPPYSVTWSGPVSGNVTNQTGAAYTISGLSAGNYSVTVTDGDDSKSLTNVTIDEPIVLTATGVQSQAVSCFGGNDGVALVTPSGGTSPYSITPSQTGLTAGLHTFTITDDNGCTTTVNVTITQPANLTATGVQSQAVSCFGGNDGVALVTPSGGTSPYSITPSQTGLTAGTHTFLITDANGCTTTVNVTITQPANLTATGVQSQAVSCFGGNDGVALVTPSGGTSPYSITPSQTGLSAGTHTFLVTDANGCTTTVNVTITQPANLTATGVQS